MKKVLAVLLCLLMMLPVIPALAEDDDDILVFLDFENGMPEGVREFDLTYLDGVKGKGGYFNGSKAYIQLPDNITKGVYDFTIATWVRFEYAELDYQRIFDFGTGTSNYMFLGTAWTSRNLRYEELVPGGTKVNRDTTVTMPNGEWVHIAVTKSGNTVTIYYNGEVNATMSSTFTPNDLGDTNQNFIGKSQFSADKYLSATLDNFLFAKRAYSAEEIKELATMPEMTQEDLYNLVDIPNPDNIKDNLNLPESVKGATIKWTSSDENIISTQPIQNGDFVMAPGVINRTDVDQNVTLTAEITYGDLKVTKEFNLTVKAKKPLDEMAGYIYAYFRGYVNGSNSEVLAIHLAASKDGLTWFDLNGNFPVLISNVGTRAVRDPYIIRSPHGDRFYLLATDLNTEDGGGWTKWSMQGSKYLIVWESDDLVNWSEPRMVKFGDLNMGCAWAPEAIYDEETGEYWVYAAGKNYGKTPVIDTVFLAKTRDFRTFTAPEVFVGGDGTARIDTTIIKANDGKFYRFTKKASSYVDMQVADSLHDTWTDVPGFQTIPGEGPAIFKMLGDDYTYCLLIDDYSKFVPYITTDIASGKFTKADYIKMPTGSKHGVVLAVTQEEYDRVLEKWGGLKPGEPGSAPILEYDFEDDSAAIFGNAQYEIDEETQSRVLKLDGINSYMQFPDNLFDRRDTFTLTMDVKFDNNILSPIFAVGKDNLHEFRVNMSKLSATGRLTLEGTINDLPTRSSLNLEGWNRVAIRVEPSKVSVFANGGLLCENENMTRTIYHLAEKDLVAYIGKSFANAYFSGAIDNVKLYDRALSLDEIWGEIPAGTDEEAVEKTANMLGFVQDLNALTTNLELPKVGINGAQITWASSDENVITNEGVITRSDDDVTVLLTATITKGEYRKDKHFIVTVKAKSVDWISGTASGNPWPYYTFEEQTGEFYFEYEITANELTDGVVGLIGSSVTPNAWNSSSMVIRLQPGGYMDARNGEGFSYNTYVQYEPGKTYLIKGKANVASRVYSVTVTTPEGYTYQLANNFSFRSDAPYVTGINKIMVVGGSGVSGGKFTVSNFKVYNTPTPSIRDIKVTDDKVSCTISSFEPGSFDLYIAEYGTDKKLLGFTKYDVNFMMSSRHVYEAALNEGSYVKFFLWKDGKIEPLCKAKARNIIRVE